MIEDVVKDAQRRMDKAIDAFRQELVRLRTGRAHPSLLDHVHVDYYGTPTPIGRTANVTVLDPRTLQVQAWDKAMTAKIEKAIRSSDLGLNPSTAGDVIRIPLPPLTEERRREMTRVVRHEAENARVAVRNVRRDANQMLKEFVKEKEITEDDERRAEERIQKLTDEHIKRIDGMGAEKEKELMQI
ncbi:MAG: ribosome recycling factor [Gammaproteobacteria bacterium]